MMIQQPSPSPRVRKIDEALKVYGVADSIWHAQSVLFLDQQTNMPKEGVNARAKAMGDLEVLARNELLKIDKIKYIRGGNYIEKGMIRELRSAIEYAKRIPEDLAREMEVESSRSLEIWKVAKKKSNFKLVQPNLEKIVEMKRKAAEYLKYNDHPYDALFDLYEHEMTVKEMDRIFAALLPKLKQIQDRTTMRNEHPLEKLEYSRTNMKRVTREIEKMLKISRNSFRSDVSEHPFSVALDVKDIRITTNFQKRDFKNSLFDSVHEFGHALYAFHIDSRLKSTPAGDSASYGWDESQSRFWENIVGHSMSFVRVLQPYLQKHLGITETTAEIYQYFNLLKHDMVIRMASNELEYDSHIAIRYEIEKGLISGEIEVSELPQIWEEHMVKYIGIKPTSDRDGVLQDMHWYGGDFGYFSTYTIGNIISGMLWKKIGNLEELIEQKKFDYIREFLGEQIHRHGSIYNPKDLLNMVFEKSYDQSDYIEYLENKYLKPTEELLVSSRR